MSDIVRRHYELHPYPAYPLLASVRTSDTYALNLKALWARFNGIVPRTWHNRILLAGCGSFSPYPFSLANPSSEITALDLSSANLRRARLHCLLHGRFNITYQAGDLLDKSVATGPYSLIDAYGVLHHLDDPAAGLRSLASRLTTGGIMRVMVYSRYARREEESIRRALRMIGIRDVTAVRALIRRAPVGSRLRAYRDSSPEATFDAGLADALLHPRVRTFRIDELLGLVEQAGLEPVMFAHQDALEHVGDETARLRDMEKHREAPGNFLVFLRKGGVQAEDRKGALVVELNPCLHDLAGSLLPGTVRIPPRLGCDNPALGWRDRRFLNGFRIPVPVGALESGICEKVNVYKKALFLIEYVGKTH